MNELERLCGEHPILVPMERKIEEAYRLLLSCFRQGNKLLLCGNGGSCSDCQHIAGELMKGFLLKRPLTAAEKQSLTVFGTEGVMLAGELQRALPVIVLSDLQGLSTAYANDVNPNGIFAQQAFAFARPGDALLGISTSGNAENVRLAALAAKARGAKVIGLTGRGGGKLAPYCDVLVDVPETETYRVQELHLPIYHALCILLEAELFGGGEA